MFRRIGQAVAVGVAAILLTTACGVGNGSTPSSTGVSASGASTAAPKQNGTSSQPDGLPAPDPITNDGSNSCAGQGLHANVAADAKPPYGIQQKAPRVRLDNGASLDASELQMNVQGTYLTVQVSARGSFMCGVYTKRNGVWKKDGAEPFQTLWLNGVQEVYATAYDPGLAIATDGE